MARHTILTVEVLIIATGCALYHVAALAYWARWRRMPDKAGLLVVQALTLAGLWSAWALGR